MGAEDYQYTSLDSGLFVQPGGPGTTLRFLGCHDLDDVEAPQGSIEIIQTFRADRSGWDVVGSKHAVPELVTTTVTGLSKTARDWLEKYICHNGALFVMKSNCGRVDNPMGYERALVLHHLNIATKTYAGWHMREEDAESTFAAEFEAWPPLIEVAQIVPGRQVTTEVQSLNDIWVDRSSQCQGDCGSAVNPGDVAGIACQAAGGATPDVLLTSTGGAAWALAAADPGFPVGDHAMAIVAFPINKSGRRWLVAKAAEAAVQGEVSYSDDAGVSWTDANMGAVAHGPTYGGGMFALSKEFIFIASAAGYIYKSIDGGQTWVAKESGVVTAGAYTGVHFYDEKYGCAVAAAGVVALTTNGGESWFAGGTIGAGAHGNQCVRMLSPKRILVGDDGGHLWQSVDGGTSWTEITGWTGSGTGGVRGLDAAPNTEGYVLWMAHNTAGPVGSVLRSIDGGANWVPTSPALPTNVGVNAIKAVDVNTAYVVGLAQGGTGYIAKVVEA